MNESGSGNSSAEPRDCVAVLGLGTMGHGIAQTFALAGYSVRGFDALPAARESVHERVATNLRAFVAAGLVDAERSDAALARISVLPTLAEAVAGCDFVTEAVCEDLAEKQRLFAELEPLLEPQAILASNSSSFPISQSAARMCNRTRAIVTHWFNPPHLVPLVEVVPGPETAVETTAATMQLLRAIGKRPVCLRKELPGFLVNRIQIALMREIWDLLEQGVAGPSEIDEAVRTSMGFRLAAVGPLEVHDFGGLDIHATVFQNLVPEIRSRLELPRIIADLVAQGHLGAKTGRGFYDYAPGEVDERRARRDELFLALTKMLYSNTTSSS